MGSDPTTLGGLLASFGKSKKLSALTSGIITDGYLPSLGSTNNSWIALFKKIHAQYLPKLPFDGNVEYGMAAAYTFAEALKAASDGRIEPLTLEVTNQQSVTAAAAVLGLLGGCASPGPPLPPVIRESPL